MTCGTIYRKYLSFGGDERYLANTGKTFFLVGRFNSSTDRDVRKKTNPYSIPPSPVSYRDVRKKTNPYSSPVSYRDVKKKRKTNSDSIDKRPALCFEAKNNEKTGSSSKDKHSPKFVPIEIMRNLAVISIILLFLLSLFIFSIIGLWNVRRGLVFHLQSLSFEAKNNAKTGTSSEDSLEFLANEIMIGNLVNSTRLLLLLSLYILSVIGLWDERRGIVFLLQSLVGIRAYLTQHYIIIMWANSIRRTQVFLVLSLCTILTVIWLIWVLPYHPMHYMHVRPNYILGNLRDGPEQVTRQIDQTYEFLVFKKKEGWHFDFPYSYYCEKYNASVTVRYSKNASDIVGANAVFFSTGPFELNEWHALHRYRSPDQIWIFATEEAASIVPDLLPPKVYRYNTYNWSFTFHHASDIHGAYGWYTPFTKRPSKINSDNWYKSKTKFAAWVSSRHCGGLGWDRTKFVKDLGNFIPIDMYGTCGNLTLERNTKLAKGIFKTYKFFLSLENSCCSEYLTEKVWNVLDWETVPIVIGGTKEEYNKLMPPHSYIHADDFDSMTDLAEYIRKVSKNETLYNEYFEWKKMGNVLQQGLRYRFPIFKEGSCKIVEKIKKLKKSSGVHMFDPYGSDWFGSCYRCGKHQWIQDYNFWWRRTIFGKDWEDNRTLLWLDGNQNQSQLSDVEHAKRFQPLDYLRRTFQ